MILQFVPWLKIENGAPVLVFFTTSTYVYKGKAHNRNITASENLIAVAQEHVDAVSVLLENLPDNYQHGAELPSTKYTNKDLGMKEEKEVGTSRSKMI